MRLSKLAVLDRCVRDPDTECWLFTGRIAANGYGRMTRDGRSCYVHRHVYEALIGPIAIGLQIDHLCRNRSCCNPDHLEPVTGRVNLLRSPLTNSTRTHCRRGHLLDGRRKTGPRSGKRYCLTCSRERMARRRATQDRPNSLRIT